MRQRHTIIRFSLLLFVVIVLMISGCAASRYISQGMNSLQTNDLDGAIEAFDLAIESSPDFAEAYYHRGNTWALKKEYQKAIADFSEAIELEPDYAKAYFSRATAFIDQGDEPLGLSDLNKAIEIDPDITNAYFVRALLYKKMGDADKALTDFSHVINTMPEESFIGYYHRGILYKETGETNLALADFTKAISINPWDPGPYIQRAEIRLSQKRYDEAIEQCRLALYIFPLAASAFRIRGDALMGKKDYDLALWNYSEAIDLDSDEPSLYAKRGEAWKRSGNLSAACMDFQSACQLMDCSQSEFRAWMAEHCRQ